ncbi:MAG TPA: alanine--tRNA ligase [Planctomycetes bacterium]|nr:alanine--tRNA ligase [Planctomycetota bacterium]HIJ70234.1 alanine--tRNA ligase [Planctomycetota bacterium]
MLTAKEIRSGFIDFFKDKGHQFIPSAPVVPIGDETLLFTNAGMNQFKDIFLGLKQPDYPRAANSQKCIRVSGKHNDLEEVGLDTYHHTFFEMLGNWSFGDYFKAEAIEWAWQLLTEVYRINPDSLWATVFAGDKDENLPPDEEARDLWPKITPIPVDRVLKFGKKDNFWEMGTTGPCGPCSEIHIDLGPDCCDMKNVPGHRCRVNGGCARFIELWNLVFIQFNRKSAAQLDRLSANYVDTGAGLERIAAVLQNKSSNYDTDLFSPIICAIADATGHKYTSQLQSETDSAFRVIADHLRSVAFAIADGVTPSNEGRGYVIRRILRRAARFGRVLGMHEPFLYKLVNVLSDVMGNAFGEIKERADFVATVIENEEASFGRTLDRGLEIFTSAAKNAKGKTISGQDAFMLYDTYGFPLDLTELMAREQGLRVDTGLFNELMEAQRERARAAQKSSTIAIDLTGFQLSKTDDSSKYKTDSITTRIHSWIKPRGRFGADHISGTLSTQEASPPDNNVYGETIGLILEETCFYAEAGGQVGDGGEIKSGVDKFTVERTEKIGDCVIHWGKLAGSMSSGQEVTAIVDKERADSKKNHTATHLLQWALRDVLGGSVTQQGSLVCPDYLRFDFTCPKALTSEQIRLVEGRVNERIAENIPVACAVMPIDEAKKLGAMALFGEKYGNEVRVVAIGAEDESSIKEAFSREFCGGTHVANTGEIGGFKVIKEESISAGVRRITALTGRALNEYITQQSKIIDDLVEMLKVPVEELPHRVRKLIDDNKDLSRQLKSAAREGKNATIDEVSSLLAGAEKIANTALIVGRLSPAPVAQVRNAIDSLKKKAKSAAIVLGFAESEDKALLLAALTDDIVNKGISASDIIAEIATVIGGSGGGRPHLAQAGGKDAAKLNEALEIAVKALEKKLKALST